MGVSASFTLLGDAVSSAQNFVRVFALVYTLVILLYIVMSWVRLPYSPTLERIQRFLYDVCEPYLRLFRRVLPTMGPLDFSPMLALFALWGLEELVNWILGRFA
jgi:YggT family protein